MLTGFWMTWDCWSESTILCIISKKKCYFQNLDPHCVHNKNQDYSITLWLCSKYFLKKTWSMYRSKFSFWITLVFSPSYPSQVVGVAQAINKKCGEDGAFTDQDEKVSRGHWFTYLPFLNCLPLPQSIVLHLYVYFHVSSVIFLSPSAPCFL